MVRFGYSRLHSDLIYFRSSASVIISRDILLYQIIFQHSSFLSYSQTLSERLQYVSLLILSTYASQFTTFRSNLPTNLSVPPYSLSRYSTWLFWFSSSASHEISSTEPCALASRKQVMRVSVSFLANRHQNKPLYSSSYLGVVDKEFLDRLFMVHSPIVLALPNRRHWYAHAIRFSKTNLTLISYFTSGIQRHKFTSYSTLANPLYPSSLINYLRKRN